VTPAIGLWVEIRWSLLFPLWGCCGLRPATTLPSPFPFVPIFLHRTQPGPAIIAGPVSADPPDVPLGVFRAFFPHWRTAWKNHVDLDLGSQERCPFRSSQAFANPRENPLFSLPANVSLLFFANAASRSLLYVFRPLRQPQLCRGVLQLRRVFSPLIFPLSLSLLFLFRHGRQSSPPPRSFFGVDG